MVCRFHTFAILVTLAGPAVAQPAPDPPRTASPQDLRLLDTRYAVVKEELGRMGLHQAVGRTCTAFITADSIRPIETPLPLDGGTVTLPYASFLIWSPDRPFADAVLYHIFSPADARYTQPVQLLAGSTPAKGAVSVTLAKRERYPAASDLVQRHAGFAGPFADLGAKGPARALAVRPYTLPTQSDDPASDLPRKTERTLQVTCLIDPARVTNCLCAGTD